MTDDLIAEPGRRFGVNLRRLRKSRDMGPTALIHTLQELGWKTNQTHLQRIEDHERPLILGEALLLSKAVGCSLEEMLSDDDTSTVMRLHRLATLLRRARDEYALVVTHSSGLDGVLAEIEAQLRNVDSTPETDSVAELLADLDEALRHGRPADAVAEVRRAAAADGISSTSKD